MLSLRELQVRFFNVLCAERAGTVEDGESRSVTADSVLLEVINRDGALGPAERLAIYAGMYRTRLLDVLREDFPRTLAIVGDEMFARLACAYLSRYRSTNASVRHLGHRFADFLETRHCTPMFLADLARLEWARVEVFDALDVVPLRVADLHSVPAHAWPRLSFRLIPACVVLQSAWPVHHIWAAAETARGNCPEPSATTIRVWREEWSVSHAAMGVAEQRAFRALQRGATFAEICAAIEDDFDADAAAQEVGGILMRWLEDGLLAPLGGTVFASASLVGKGAE